MLKRPYSNTGDMLTIIGFGGIIVDRVEQPEANSYVAEAIDAGVNYFDVAPTYGIAEDRLGPALEPYRQKVFLACKTGKRTKDEARVELETSLKKLRTDHFDLYQLHAMTTEEDFEQAIGPNGVLETVAEAQQKGIIRHVGFSAHSQEIALKLIDAYDFKSVLLPINFVNVFNGDFGLPVIEKARAKGMAVLALKAMAKTVVPEGSERPNPRCWYAPLDDMEIAKLAVRYTLSQDITAAIPPGDIRLFRVALEAVKDFHPITEEEVARLKEYAKGLTPIFKAQAS